MQEHLKHLFNWNPLALFEYLSKIDKDFKRVNFTENTGESFFSSMESGFSLQNDQIYSFYNFCKSQGYDINKNLKKEDLKKKEILKLIKFNDETLFNILQDIEDYQDFYETLKKEKKVIKLFLNKQFKSIEYLQEKGILIELEFYEENSLKNNFDIYNFYIDKIKKTEKIQYLIEHLEKIKEYANEPLRQKEIVQKTEELFDELSENDRKKLLIHSISYKNEKYFNHLSKKLNLTKQEKKQIILENINEVEHHSFLYNVLDENTQELLSYGKNSTLNLINVIKKAQNLGYKMANSKYSSNKINLINEGFVKRVSKIFNSTDNIINLKTANGTPIFAEILLFPYGIVLFGESINLGLNQLIKTYYSNKIYSLNKIQENLNNTIFLKDANGSYIFESHKNQGTQLAGILNIALGDLNLKLLNEILTEQQKHTLFNNLLNVNKDNKLNKQYTYDANIHSNATLKNINTSVILDYLYKTNLEEKTFSWQGIEIEKYSKYKISESEMFFTIRANKLSEEINNRTKHNEVKQNNNPFKI